MKNAVSLVLQFALALSFGFQSFANEPKSKDSHDHEEKGHKHDEKEEQGHGGHEDGGANIGPGKGVTEKGVLGLKFSTEALKTIAPAFVQCSGSQTSVPATAIVRIKDSKSVIRVREGWYKRVPIEILSKLSDGFSIRSSELKSGDQIVSTKAGFFRMAEVIAEEGAAHSHAH